MNTFTLPAEWEKQSYIQLTWPHAGTDWADMLDEAEDCFYALAEAIAKRQPLLVVAPEYPERLKDVPFADNITFFACDTNDTWARDHAFLTMLDSSNNARLLDFQFNGWGMKFAADKDNKINKALYTAGILNGEYENHLDFVLEGGSIESDGEGTLLTTSHCLLAPNRNEGLGRDTIEETLKTVFDMKQVLWIDHGYLAGDDTDSHVDTLVRMCPNNTLVYVQCSDEKDEHFAELQRMEIQLHEFRTLEGEPYRLLPLPMADAIYDENGERLPATYANFLIMNDAILYPTYGQPHHELVVVDVLRSAFPHKEIVGIDCRALIKQHGSLHCVTMQYPYTVKPSKKDKQ